jgi:tetratricopeptide (TPR) repeat protein
MVRSSHRKPLLLGAWLVTAACGCAAKPARPVEAVPPAPAAAPRRFVSPYSYEWFVRAELLAARGQHAAAVEAYRMALTSADEDPYVLARLAEALDRSGDTEGAADALAAGLQIDPRSEAVWLASGRIAERRGSFERALEAYERAEAAAPHASDAPFALAGLLERSGHPERAIAVLERFAARNAELERVASRSAGVEAKLLRARISLARAHGDGAALAEAARRFRERGGGDPELTRRVARELLAAGQPALAARLLAALPPSDRDARLRLDAWLTLARTDAAELLLATTSPEPLGGPVAVAEAYLAIDQPARALESLEQQSAAHEPDPQRRTVARAGALLALGHLAEAAMTAAQVPPSSTHHRAALAILSQALESAALPALSRELTTKLGAAE